MRVTAIKWSDRNWVLRMASNSSNRQPIHCQSNGCLRITYHPMLHFFMRYVEISVINDNTLIGNQVHFKEVDNSTNAEQDKWNITETYAQCD